jgi:pyruvate dehydrogenase E2 component (dihydrolipoamide acetyltransferase)
MAEEVQLPELGESVEEGIITQWLVEVGDTVDVDQPLVEISTDKVDTEIPSPIAGTVQELRAEVDDTILVGDVIAVIGDGDASGSGEEGDADSGDEGDAGGDDEGAAEPAAAEPEPSEVSSPAPAPAAASSSGDVAAGQGVLTSPLVRRMLREAGIDASSVSGTGPGGRITRADAEAAVERGPQEATAAPEGEASAAPAPAASGRAAPQAAPVAPPPPAPVGGGGVPERPSAGTRQIDFGGDREVTEDISRVRRAIAKGMKGSLDTTAQLTAIVEVDMTRVMNLRAAVKDQFRAQHGASLSPLPFIMRAVAMTLQRHPVLNSTMDLDSGTATFKRYINLGMAVDTERGLLVPNIKNAEDLTVAGLAKRIAEIAKRTRGKGLKPDDIVGGTFTVTNTGSLGTLMDTPILNPPEVGILGAAAIEKRPVVVSDGYGDSIAIRWMTYLCLSYDHMALDGADAARFLQDLKWTLEHHDFTAELGL